MVEVEPASGPDLHHLARQPGEQLVTVDAHAALVERAEHAVHPSEDRVADRVIHAAHGIGRPGVRAFALALASPRQMFFRQILHDDLGCASYVIASAGEGAVVDPKWDIGEYLALTEEHGFEIRYVLETHNHADHVSGRGRLAAA